MYGVLEIERDCIAWWMGDESTGYGIGFTFLSTSQARAAYLLLAIELLACINEDCGACLRTLCLLNAPVCI